MPSPKNARKEAAKKTPEKAEVQELDLGQKLSQKKSQDFKSKIELWDLAGAETSQQPQSKAQPQPKPQRRKSENATPKKENDVKAAAPKTPNALDISGAIDSLGRKVSRDVDVEKKAWVRRRSKTQPSTPQVKTEKSPGVLRKSPPVTPSKMTAPNASKSPAIIDEEDVPATKRTFMPKKRVISDEHWRKDRVPQTDGDLVQGKGKETTPTAQDKESKLKLKEKETTPKAKVIRQSIANIGLKVPPSVYDFKDIPEPSRDLRRQLKQRDRSRSSSRGREDDRAATPDYESSGTKLYIKRRRRSKPLNDAAEECAAVHILESSLTEPSSADRPSSARDVSTPEMTHRKMPVPRSSTDPHLKAKRFLTSQPSPERLDDPRTALRNTSRGREDSNIKGDRDRSALRQSPPTQRSVDMQLPAGPPVYGNRIEGWLAEMPDDPFTESTAPIAPESLGLSHAILKQHNSTVNRSNGVGREDRGERPVPKPDDPDEYELLATSRSLRQNRAPRQPRFTGPDQDRDNARLRENVRSNSAESRSQVLCQNNRDQSRHHCPPGTGNRLSTILSVSTVQEQDTSRPDDSILSRASDGDEPTKRATVVRNRTTKHSDLMSVLSLPREDDHVLASARSIRTRRPRHDLLTAGDLMNEVTTDELKYQRELRTLVDGVIPVLLQYVLAQKQKPAGHKAFARDDRSLTQPIVDMGIALERLKACHKRIPMHDPNELLLWAESTAKVYSGFVDVWRLGFGDVVVNLAPAEQKKASDSSTWENEIKRNAHGDLLNGDGERVDVAYLLKRPLIRIKDLGKTLKAISQIRPSRYADSVWSTYEDLVSRAKQRTNDERARLEDEAASAIDPSRARDPHSLAPLVGVDIDPSRRVAARDFFDLEFFHTSGQQIDCRIELIIRDDPPDSESASGDVLICEISSAGRWLLFPPLLTSSVSSRHGDKDGELVMMIRGKASNGGEWRELLSLQSTEEQSTDWIGMLGSEPAPPRLTRRSSFNTMRAPRVHFASAPSSTASDLPIGERASSGAPRWDGSEVNSTLDSIPESDEPKLDAPSFPRHPAYSPRGRVSFETRDVQLEHRGGPAYSPPNRTLHGRSVSDRTPDTATGTKKGYGDLPSSWDQQVSGASFAQDDDRPQRRPTVERRTSSVPSMELPTVHKLRRFLTPNASSQSPEVDSAQTAQPSIPTESTSAPASVQKMSPPTLIEASTAPVRVGGLASVPSFTPAFLKRPRRSSSPLKHEYEPSTATESSESEESDAEDNESITSDSSAEEAVSTLGELRDFKNIVPLRQRVHSVPLETHRSPDADTIRPSESASLAPYRAIPTSTSGSAKSVACLFSWSDRGAWESIHPEECQIVVTPGLIEAFDLAQANAVAPQTGSLDVPSPSSLGVKPLVALELTPWVPLRRGTAVDISIRSSPTSNSVLRNGNNLMFRSRSPEECEQLYNLINRARIDNPTWMALQNARGPVQTSNWGEVMDRRNAARSDANNSSWLKSLSRKGSTYRSKGTRSASVAGSQSSVGTKNSAFSAIRQFSGSSKIFNIAKSTIMTKRSTQSSHSDSLSSGIATPLPIDTSMGTPVGITNTKIRLYLRETTTKWRDLGNAHLTVMLPPRRDTSGPADPRTTGLEKRILVCGKKDNVILDVTLGESCFERVARTGIAVSVWEEDIGPNGEVGHAAATGGVATSRSTIYMIQMKSEREAAYTFSMVGKLRY